MHNRVWSKPTQPGLSHQEPLPYHMTQALEKEKGKKRCCGAGGTTTAAQSCYASSAIAYINENA